VAVGPGRLELRLGGAEAEGGADGPEVARGERAGATAPAEERVRAWVREGRTLLPALAVLLQRLDGLERECQQLQADNDRLRAERAEVAEALGRALEALARPLAELSQRLRVA
jgi:hypothetical protein